MRIEIEMVYLAIFQSKYECLEYIERVDGGQRCLLCCRGGLRSFVDMLILFSSTETCKSRIYYYLLMA